MKTVVFVGVIDIITDNDGAFVSGLGEGLKKKKTHFDCGTFVAEKHL